MFNVGDRVIVKYDFEGNDCKNKTGIVTETNQGHGTLCHVLFDADQNVKYESWLVPIDTVTKLIDEPTGGEY